MLRCTYIILLNNNENNISNLIDSLKDTSGNFRKEFIIVDDGSIDNTLSLVKAAVNDLPRSTIITQENEGFAVSVNKAISLATGDYIHFVEGDEILHPLSTTVMIDSCIRFGTELVCCSVEEMADNEIRFLEKMHLDERLIQDPIAEILLNKISPVKNIGGSGTLVSRALLEKVGKADTSIYSQTMSLSLRCAKHSKFLFLNNVLSLKQKRNSPAESNFELHNNLQAIYRFAKDNPDICKEYKSELLFYLSQEALTKKAKIKYYLYSIKAKYLKLTNLDTILEFYKTEYEKLF